MFVFSVQLSPFSEYGRSFSMQGDHADLLAEASSKGVYDDYNALKLQW